jgi:hypothetical protein
MTARALVACAIMNMNRTAHPKLRQGKLKDHEMHIEVSTGNSIDGSEGLTSHIKDLVQHELANMEKHITRIEVHLSDDNADKSGPDDIQCMLEVRLEGLQPTVVRQSASTVEQATKGAAVKMKNALESILGKRADRR